jgi:hypothetical protein
MFLALTPTILGHKIEQSEHILIPKWINSIGFKGVIILSWYFP